jgi:thiol-disulfide isomerase/thioredoxin
MKKSLLIFLSTFAVFAAFAQNRTVLAEEFTNASCPPCAAFNPKFHPFLEKNIGKVISLKYQVNYPGADPMNAQNNAEAAARNTYYGITGVPTPLFDGAKKTQPEAYTQSVLDAAYNKSAPYDMDIKHRINAKYDSIFISIKIKNNSGVDFVQKGQKLHVAIVEKEITFPKAPGTNGEKVFYSIMRKMLPNNLGTTFPDSLKAGQEVTFLFNVPLPKYIYGLDQIAAIAFVQNNTTKVINQTDYTEPQAVVGNFVDLSSVNKTVTPSSVCETEITPTLEFTNSSSVDVTSFDAFYNLAGKKSTSIPWTGKLGKGEKTTVTFPATSLVAGKASILNGSFTNVNNGAVADYSSLNNTTPDVTFRVIPATPAANATSLKVNFETTAVGALPTSSFLYSDRASVPLTYVADKSLWGSTVTQKVGGFGQSTKSFVYAFLRLDKEGENVDLTFFKINLKDSKETKLKFDHAYAQYLTTTGNVVSDKFEVLASTDCGKTYKTLFSKEGDDLKTAEPTAAAFLPTDSDWKSNEVDMSALDGKPEVLMVFRGISGYGNLMLIDNINVEGKIVGVKENILDNATMEVNPNPAADYTYVNMDLNEDMTASVKIFDITGKQVATLADNQAFGSGNYQLRWDIEGVAQGVYVVKIETAKGQLTKRLTVMN